MSKIITAILALAFAALTGCSSFTKKEAPRYAPPPAAQIQQPVAQAAPAPKLAAATATSVAVAPAPTDKNQFNPGILSAEQKAQNLKKCEGWGKLSAAEKKKKDFFCWQHVGADPYQGKVESALAQSHWPAEVQSLFLNQIRQGNKAEMVLERGMTFDWSTFGKGVSKAFVHRNVVAGWKESEVHSASVFTVSHGGKIYKMYLPRDCGNWSGNVYSVATPAPATVTSTCPNGWSVTANAWSLKSMPEGLRKEIEARIAAAKARSKANLSAFATSDSVSRYGKRLREEVKIQAPVVADLTTQIGTRNVGVLKMSDGIGTFNFFEDPRSDVVTITWPGFISPEEGVMKIFPREWQICEPHIHGIVP